ncbi:MAG: dihydroanticapsin 7-dehydrogenase [Acidimicrobiales bacterium]|nr:MAG: dihydroanticapsin 7-dehydrogenase [Acidimicrobiales bacterium]
MKGRDDLRSVSDLSGARVVITGGGSGIGRASAVLSARLGAKVSLIDIRPALLREAAELVRAAGGEVWEFEADVAHEDRVTRAIEEAADRMGGIDGVVVCAGVATEGRLHDLTLHDWNLVISVNLTGAFLTIRAALPHMIEAGGGSVVTIGSVSSVVIGSGGSAASYMASKGGLLQLTRAVAVEYARWGIRANCVCPAGVRTNMGRHSGELAAITTTRSEHDPPSFRIEPPIAGPADPEDVASVVAFLLSSASSFMTGSAVMVDGGYTAI